MFITLTTVLGSKVAVRYDDIQSLKADLKEEGVTHVYFYGNAGSESVSESVEEILTKIYLAQQPAWPTTRYLKVGEV